jgi:hypothetical protein
MRTVNPLPLTTFSQVDYPIELENLFDEQQNRIFVRYTTTTGNVGATSVANFAVGDFIFITFIDTSVSGVLSLYEIRAEITAKTSSLNVTNADLVYTTFPSGVTLVSYRLEGETTPYDITFGLQPSGGATTNFRIRANSQGKGKVFIGEILRQYLPEFIAPKDYETGGLISINYKEIAILFNGVSNTIEVFYGSKNLSVNYFYNTIFPNNPFGQKLRVFKEQIAFYYFQNFEALDRTFIMGTAADYPIGDLDSAFSVYPAIPCKNKIYLSANYGLLPDGELIDVSVPVLAFVNRAGQYEYIRFTGSNVNKYNVQEARLKQDYASTLTNADIGLIYEGIELTLADDNTNQGFAYRIDKIELQRCLALLMESPKAWLLVNGDLQQALEVRVKRESVVFASSFDKTYGNYTAQCEVIVTQTLGQPQY